MKPVFETERLTVRPWTLDDVDAAFAIYGDPEVVEFIRDAPEESIATQRATLEAIATRFRNLGSPYGFWAIVEVVSAQIVGSIILKPLPIEDLNEVEVGWHLARHAWGKGFATEAARACIDYGFQTLERDRLVAVVDPQNTRSLAVTQRLGMHPLGRVRAYGHDLEMFVIRREEL